AGPDADAAVAGPGGDASGDAAAAVRAHRAAERDHPGDGADGAGQDDDAVRGAGKRGPVEPERDDDRGPGRVPPRRDQPDAGEPEARRDVRDGAAEPAAAGPGRDPGGRGARPGDGGAGDPGLADGAP